MKLTLALLFLAVTFGQAFAAEQLQEYPLSIFVLDSAGRSGGSPDWRLFSFPAGALEGKERNLKNQAAIDLPVPPLEILRIGLISGCQQCTWKIQTWKKSNLIDSWEVFSSLIPPGGKGIVRPDEWTQAALVLNEDLRQLQLAGRNDLPAKFRSVDTSKGIDRVRVTLVGDAAGSTAFRLVLLGRN